MSGLGSDRARQVLPLVSDLIDKPSTLVLKIRGRDFASAARDLQEYRDLTRTLDTLVIDLDLGESDIAEFGRASGKNALILGDLMNSTERWDELRTLEIRYRDAGDPQTLTSITYEGESLRRHVQDLYREYITQDQAALNAAAHYGLNTTGYEAGTREFRSLANDVSADQEKRMGELPGAPGGMPAVLTLAVDPAAGAYQDTLALSGRLGGTQNGNVPVDLFIDSRRAGTVNTGGDGAYSFRYTVNDLPSGDHTAFAVHAGSVFSPLQEFRVDETRTEITLDIPPPRESGALLCQGVLTAGGRPVPGMPVQVLVDGAGAARPVTGDRGEYRALVKASPGTHRVSARFDQRGLPLSGSTSPVVEVTVPEAAAAAGRPWWGPVPPVQAGIMAVAAGLAALGAWAYLRRNRRAPRRPRAASRGPAGAGPAATLSGPPGPGGQHPAAGKDTALAEFLAMAGTDLREAVFFLFSHLRSVAGAGLSLANPASLTPRELCERIRGSGKESPVCRFTRAYEAIRYGGAAGGPVEQEELVKSYTASLRDQEGRHA
jgi:hypothetical protein